MTLISTNLKSYLLFPQSLLWREERSHLFQYFFELISNLQIIAVIGSSQCYIQEPVENDVINILLQSFFEKASFSGLLVSEFQTLFALCFTWFYLFLLLIFIIFIVYQCRKHSDVGKTYIIMSYWSQFHHTFAFWIIHTLMLYRANDLYFNDNSLLGSQIRHVEIVLNLISFVLNIVFAIFSAHYCYDPLITNNPFAMYSTTFQTTALIFKLSMGPIVALDWNESLSKWIFLILTVIITGIRYEFLLKTMPFYNYSGFLFASCLSGCAFYMSFTNFFVGLLVQVDVISWSNLNYTRIPLVLFALKLAPLRIHTLVTKYASISVNQLKGPNDIFKKIFALRYNIEKASITSSLLLANSHNLSSIYLEEEILFHKANCQDNECLCKSENDADDTNHKNFFRSNKDSLRFAISLQTLILGLSVKRFWKNDNLKIQYAYMLISKLKNFSRALFTIFEINHSKTTFKQKVLLSLLSKYFEQKNSTIVKHLSQNKNYSFDIKKTLDSLEKSNELTIIIGKYVSEYIQLWNYYKKPIMSLADFFRKVVQLETKAYEIDKKWTNFLNLKDHIPNHLLFVYKLYLIMVRNASYTASKISDVVALRASTNLDPDLLHRQHGKENSVIFYVSMSKERLGKVIQVSQNIKQELGWSQIEIIGQDIQTIQPLYIRERHTQLLHTYLEKNEQPPSFQRESFVQTKEGHIIPVHVLVTIYPYIQNEPIYVGIVNKRLINKETLVVGADGGLRCFSKSIGTKLGLDQHKKISLNQICPDSAQLRIGNATTGRKTSIFSTLNEAILLNKSSSTRDNKSKVEEPETEKILKFNSYSKISEIIYSVQVQKHYVLGNIFYYLYLTEQTNNNAIKSNRKDFNTPRNTDVHQSEETHISTFSPRSLLIKRKEGPNPISVERLITAKTSIFKGKKIIEISRGLRKTTEELFEFSCNSDENLRSLDENKEKAYGEVVAKDYLLNIQNTRSSLNLKELLKIDPASSLPLRENTNVRKKLEEAVYVVPQPKETRILKLLILAFGSLCMLFMILHLVYGSQGINTSIFHIDTVAAIQKRSIQLIDLCRNIRYITLINEDFMKDTRHISMGISSFRLARKQALKDNIGALNLLNQITRDNVHETLDFGEPFETMIHVNDGKSMLPNRTVHDFEVFTEISTAANALLGIDINNINYENPNVQFVYRNSLNDLLLISEMLVQKVAEDSKGHLENVSLDVLRSLCIACGTGIFLLVVLMFHIKNLLAKRTKIIELTLKINQNQLSNHLSDVLSFYHSFWEDNSDEYKQFSSQTKGLAVKISENQNQNAKRTDHKVVNYEGVNGKIKRGAIFTITCILIFCSAFLTLKTMYSANETSFLVKYGYLVGVDQLLTDLSLGAAATLELIGEDNSTYIRNYPIYDAMNQILEKAKKAPDFLSSLTFDDDANGDDSLLKTLIFGDICQLVQVPKVPITFCQRLGSGIVSSGLIRLIVFMVKSNEESVDSFLNSNRTFKDAQIALSFDTLITTEQVSAYSMKASEMIRNILKDQLQDEILQYKNKIVWAIVAYLTIYIILGFILSTNTWQRIQEEQNAWRKLIRHIPLAIIIESGSFKNFLINNSENLLASVKHAI